MRWRVPRVGGTLAPLVCATLCCVASAGVAQDDRGSAPEAVVAATEPATTFADAAREADLRSRDADAALNAGIMAAREHRLGHAVLWFERAHLNAPLDREVQDARAAAQREAREHRMESAGRRAVVQGEPAGVTGWRFFSSVPRRTSAVLLLLASWLLFGTIGVRARTAPGVRRDAATVIAVLSALLFVGSATMWVGRSVTATRLEPAVVVVAEPRYRDAPDELSSLRRHANLYEGAVVLLVAERDAWVQLELVDGERVWVSPDVAAPIEPASR